MEAAIAVHDSLWEDGIITPSMTDYEKARVYFTWICDNCVYDYSAEDSSLSHIAYNLFENGTAVCDGYTGAYNLLLKLEASTAPPCPTAPTSGPWPPWTARSTTSTPPGATAAPPPTTATSP